MMSEMCLGDYAFKTEWNEAFRMFVCMFQSQLQLQSHPMTVEPSLREKIVKKVNTEFLFFKIYLLCENTK